MDRRLMIVLAASLAFNVFLGGFVAGRLLSTPEMPPPPPPLPIEPPVEPFAVPGSGGADAADPNTERSGAGFPSRRGRRGGPPYLSELSPEARAAFRAAFAANSSALFAARTDLIDARKSFAEAVGAPSFDRDAVEAAAARLRAAEVERRAAHNALLLDALESLGPEDRAKIAAFERRSRPGRGRRQRDRRPRWRDRTPEATEKDEPAPE